MFSWSMTFAPPTKLFGVEPGGKVKGQMKRDAVQTRLRTSKPKSALLQVSRAQRADVTADDTLGSRINLCRQFVRAVSLGEPCRGPVERGLARRGTEVVIRTSIDGDACGPLRIDRHPAPRVFLHPSAPGFHS